MGFIFRLVAMEMTIGGGHTMLIDEDDYSLLKHLHIHMNDMGYAYAHKKTNGKQNNTRIHRLVMGAVEGQYIDHINGNRMDNRKSNLRFCTKSQNSCNRGKMPSNTSGYKGVYFNKRNKKWNAITKHNDRNIYIGTFNCATAAWFSYVRYVSKKNGEFARFA